MVLIMGFWPLTKQVVRSSDIILLICDVRMPELSRNIELEKIATFYGRRIILIFNKIDIVSQKYLSFVKSKYREAFFVSGTRNIGVNELKKYLLIMTKKMKLKEPKIGVVGYPNVGKSAIINALAKRARTKVSKHAGTTKGIQWIRVGVLLIFDSPGVIPFEDDALTLGVFGAKNSENIKNVERVAFEIIKIFINYDKKIFEDLYNIFVDIDNYWNIFEEIGKKKGFLLSGGRVDERRAALLIIKDWQSGNLRL